MESMQVEKPGSGALDSIDYAILYVVYSLNTEVPRRVINKVVARAVLIHGDRLEPLKDFLDALRINHFGWVIEGVYGRLRRLEGMGLVRLRLDSKRLFVSPAPSVNRDDVLKRAERELPSEFVLRLKESLSKLSLDRVDDFVNELEKLSGIAGIKYALIGFSAREYLDLMNRLREIGTPCPECPSSDEFLELRRKIKDLPG